MDEENALIVDGVFYRVPSLDILKGVHLKARAGAITGLFGRNGSGKTTLLKVAAGQIQPNSGLTIIDGNRLHKPSKRDRFARIGYLPQESMLPADVTVQTLVRSAGLPSARVPDRLSSRMDQRVRTLSGGERRLLEVAIVLGLERDYVLLDEPFTGVEPILIDAIGTRIERAAAQGTGVLVTDHYHQHVTPLADDAYVLWQKQCDRLDGDAPIHDQLVQMGYLGEKDENEKRE
ncbi:MAG: ATP-binding cassette domain-containing protein [Salinibacter sp.]